MEVLKQGINTSNCFECGACSASCPVRRVNSGFNPRRILHALFLGLEKDLIEEGAIWLCAHCYTCQEACPQKIKIPDIIVILKNLAYKALPPQGIRMQRENLNRYGRVYPIDEFDLQKRKKAGLPELLPVSLQAKRLMEA